jgi:hypothetical protein
MCSGKPGAQLTGDVSGLVFWEPSDATKRRREIFAADVLHREIEETGDFTDVVDATDIRVRDLARDSNLVVKLSEASGIPLQISWKELQRDGLAEPEIICSVNLTHAPAAEETNDSVSLAEDDTRGEAAVTDRVR